MEQTINRQSQKTELLEIYPRWSRFQQTWVFDDLNKKVKNEPFLLGIPEIIESFIEDFGYDVREHGFSLAFSTQPFDDYDAVLFRVGEWQGGCWYRVKKETGWMYGWLCGVLYKYFEGTPANIFFKASPIT